MSVYLQVYNAQGKNIGHFDGEFFYTNPKTNLRVDGSEVYSLSNSTYVGEVEGSTIVDLSGNILYRLQE